MNKPQKQLNSSTMQQLNQAGFSLFEILIAISVFAVMGIAVAQLIGVSLQADKAGGQKIAAVGLAQETLAAINSVTTEKWHNIYQPPAGAGDPVATKGSSNRFYPANTAADCGSIKWCLKSGIESIAVNGLAYKRSFYIENVCRDATSRDITGATDSGGSSITDCTASGGNPDLSTEKITVIVSWEDSSGNQLGSVDMSNYFTRARNTAAIQSDWSGASPPGSGEDANFGNDFSYADASISISTPSGSITLKQQ